MKPLIAITVDVVRDPSDARTGGKLSLAWNYAEQVEIAGGNPILISPQTDVSVLSEIIDGWLIPGGDDIDPKHFGQQLHPEAKLQDPSRWEVESKLFDLLGDKIPILGICYGCQFLNVKRGGTLNQHVPDEVHHSDHSGGTLQTYTIALDSKLCAASGAKIMVGKSYHHQAVQRPGNMLIVTAKHEDGTIEAIEDPTKPFFIGVQWHPERTPEDKPTQNLFKAFVAAASQYKLSKS